MEIAFFFSSSIPTKQLTESGHHSTPTKYQVPCATSQRVCCMPSLKFFIFIFVLFTSFLFVFFSAANYVNVECGLSYFLVLETHTITGKHKVNVWVGKIFPLEHQWHFSPYDLQKESIGDKTWLKLRWMLNKYWWNNCLTCTQCGHHLNYSVIPPLVPSYLFYSLICLHHSNR